MNKGCHVDGSKSLTDHVIRYFIKEQAQPESDFIVCVRTHIEFYLGRILSTKGEQT